MTSKPPPLMECAECGLEVRDPCPSSDQVDLWWCRDCLVAVCKKCQLMRGHSEHRSHAWRPEEIYQCCVQALEGRCSRRTKNIHDYKIAIKEFISKSLSTTALKDDRPSLYHLPSPSRPALKTWNLDHDDPARMMQILETAKELLQLPRTETFEVKPRNRASASIKVPKKEDFMVQLRDRSEWDARAAAEAIAVQLGTHIHYDNQSLYALSRATTPDGRSLWSSDGDLKRRGVSADAMISRRTSAGQLPMEPSVFVRDRPSVMSFRERSVPLEEAESPDHSLTNGALSTGALNTIGITPLSKPGSVMSSLPPYPADDTLNTTLSSNTTPTPIPSSQTQADTVSPSPELTISRAQNNVHLEKTFSLDQYVFSHINCQILYVSAMTAKGRSIHVFDMMKNNKKLDAIPCPKDPKIELSRTRWITVGPRGHLFMTSGDNIKSALWVYMRGRKAWKTLKESRKSRYQYLSVAEDQAEYRAVVLLTCDAANNRLLLFVVDHQLSLINEYDLSVTYRLGEHISSPASAIVDKHGNLLVLDYANGRLSILLSGEKGIRKLREVTFAESLQPQMALGITVLEDYVYVACFSTCEVRSARYLEAGKFKQFHTPAPIVDAAAPSTSTSSRPKAVLANGRSPMNERRANSVPRPPNTKV